MGFFVMSASITSVILLFPQLLQAQILGTCTDTTTLPGEGECFTDGCTANDVQLKSLLNVVPDDGQSCDGSPEKSISFTGDLTFYSNGNGGRHDVGLWFGPFVDEQQCARYGFTCNTPQDPDPFDLEGDDGLIDTCADFDGQGDWEFKGVAFNLPCEGTAAGVLTTDYCVTWKTMGQDKQDQCTSAVDIFRGGPAKCDCAILDVPEINVCPALDDNSVTVLYSAEHCEASGTNFMVEFAGIPAGITEGTYTITPEGGVTTPVSGAVTFGTPVTAALYPTIKHTVGLEFEFPDGDTCSYDLKVTPFCSCEENDDNCPDDEICCKNLNVCEVFKGETIDGTVCGDPHMTGFLGQKFDFTGEDGEWYSVIADSNMHVNMRVTSPVADLPEITYITGLSVLTTDSDGFDHSIVIEVADPHSLDSSCPAGVSPCLADGALIVLVDGEEVLLTPGTVSLGPDVEVTAANLPGACRSFGFEKVRRQKMCRCVKSFHAPPYSVFLFCVQPPSRSVAIVFSTVSLPSPAGRTPGERTTLITRGCGDIFARRPVDFFPRATRSD
ncbi:unnamed protein product [Ectocarpus fasciculatus]